MRGVLEDFDKAISRYPKYAEDLTSLQAVNPSLLAALVGRGLFCRKLGDLAHAQVDFESALAMKKDYFEAAINLGIVLKERGDLEPALAYFDHAASLKPTSALPMSIVGQRWTSLGGSLLLYPTTTKLQRLNPDLLRST
jgi:tetratricopeptide (TPR) repeat protein